jgi:hypothetical protein
MKAYELPLKLTDEGTLDLPAELVAALPQDEFLRVLILVPDETDSSEEEDWRRLATEQFFSQFAETDSVYDNL